MTPAHHSREPVIAMMNRPASGPGRSGNSLVLVVVLARLPGSLPGRGRLPILDHPAFAKGDLASIRLNRHDHRTTVGAAQGVGLAPDSPARNSDALGIDRS